MNPIRTKIDKEYSKFKYNIFKATKDDPEVAHKLMVSTLQYLQSEHSKLAYLALNDFFARKPDIEISNAAGFNKDGDIPTSILKYLGFDRVVVGTVTHDAWQGNPRPRMRRYPENESVVNWMGLPGVGSKKVKENLIMWHNSSLPLTINLMGTPGKTGNELLDDLGGTIHDTIKFTDRYELNISCPNLKTSRTEHQEQLSKMINRLANAAYTKQRYVKVSPDLDLNGVNDILDVLKDYNGIISGLTVGNSTTNHDPNFIPVSPGKGGGSGKVVQKPSKLVQNLFEDEIERRGLSLKIIACGGIDSVEEARQRTKRGAKEIQIYTPLIFKGPGLLTDIIRNY